jgi:hypothetical protein
MSFTYEINNLSTNFTKISENAKYDFYISNKKLGGDYFVYAILSGTNLRVSMAGFTTKKAARECAHIWTTWMGV